MTIRNTRLSRSDYILFGAYILLTILTYTLLHGIYRPDNMDDAWFLSFAHNHIVKGVETDITFGTTPGGGGFGGVMLFGKSYTYFYGRILNAIGWTKSHAHIISTICIFLSAACWSLLLRKIGFSKRIYILFGLALPLVEPFFAAANQARPDALSFLIVSAAALAFVFNHNIAAGLLSAIAIEIHPVGISAPLIILALFISWKHSTTSTWRDAIRTTLWLCVGGLIGLIYYYLLHEQNLHLLYKTIQQGNAGANRINNILFEYFFKTKYYRHIPELLVVVAATALFLFKRLYRETKVVPAIFVVCILFTLIIRRPNFMYIIYVYPAFLLLVLWISEHYSFLKFTGVALIAYLIPQYAIVYMKNHDWSMERYIAQIQDAVPEGTAPVVGQPNDWFAFMNRPFYATDYRGSFASILQGEFILIENDLYRSGHYPDLKSFVEKSCTPTDYSSSFESRNETITVRKFRLMEAENGASEGQRLAR